MRKLVPIVMLLVSMSSFGQTNTNRGGHGPETGSNQQCTQLNQAAKELQFSYLNIHQKNKDGRKNSFKKVDQYFEQLIRRQNLEINLKLVGSLKLPECRTCLSDDKQLLYDLLLLLERNHQCLEFDKKHDWIPLIKNIIIYGN